MNQQMNQIKDRVDNAFEDIDTQTDVTKDFTRQIENISKSYKELSDDCTEMGTHVYKIDVTLIQQEVIWYVDLLKLHSRTGWMYLLMTTLS